MMEWISVKKKLPSTGENVLCSCLVVEEGGVAFRGYRVLKLLQDGFGNKRWNCDGMIVTHWMVLPEQPKED